MMQIVRPSLLFTSVATFALASALSTAAAAQCADSCASAHDQECDDGGPGSIYAVCAFGTDCGDCGPRIAPAVTSDIMNLTLQEELYYLINEINYYVTSNTRAMAQCGLGDLSLEDTRVAVNAALNEPPTDQLLNCLDAVANLMDCIAGQDCSTMATLDAICGPHFDNVDALCQ